VSKAGKSGDAGHHDVPGEPGATDPGARTPIRCAIYTRESGAGAPGDEFDTVEAQRSVAESFIAGRWHEGWTALPVRYDDRGLSGARMDRPALLRLLADAADGKLDCLVVHRLDRLARSLPRFARLVETLQRLGVDVVSVTQQFDTGTSLGRLSLHALLAFAEFEREIISERMHDSSRRAQRNGKHLASIPPLGYRFRPGTRDLVVDEEGAALVREIFDLYLEHRSMIRVVDELRRRGRKTRTRVTRAGRQVGGIEFTEGSLSLTLANVAYAGKTRCDGEVLPARHEAILSEAVYNAAARLRKANRCASPTPRPSRPPLILCGRIRCRACHAPMKPLVRVIGKREQRFYACTAAKESAWHSCLTRAVSAPAMERAVAEVLFDAGSSLERVRDLIRLPPGTSSDAGQELERRVYRMLSVFRASWGLLDRRERPRALRALLAEVDYDARDGTLGVALKASGFDWLTAEGDRAKPPDRRPSRGILRLEAEVDPALMRGPSSRRSWVTPLRMTAAERLALAHTIEGLVRDGGASNYTEAAQQLNYSPSRLMGVMVQLFLAPAIQHEILSLGDEALRSVREADLCKIARKLDWNRQWEHWAALRSKDHPCPGSGTNHGQGAGASRRADARLRKEIERLREMTVAALQMKHSKLFGAPCRSNRTCFLRRRVAWGLQALAMGGLSDVAEERLEQLGEHALARLRAARPGHV